MNKNLSWLWFDLDNTLLDFSGASKKAFNAMFESYDLPDPKGSYLVYRRINSGYWKRFEEGKVTAQDIRMRRFTDLFQELGIKHIDGYEANERYMHGLVDYSEPYDGVHDLLKNLKHHYKLSIITNGLKEAQRPRMKKTGIYDYFDSIIVSDEIRVSKPEIGIFQHVYDSLPFDCNKDEIMIIGDSWNSDMTGGKNYGIKTCWISDKDDHENDWTPDFIIKNVLKLKSVLAFE